MRVKDLLRTSLQAITSHVLRSALTVLGIMIGIAAVILSVGLGLGTQKDVSAEISSLGSNLLIVSPGTSQDSSGVRGGFGSGTTLSRSDAQALASEIAVPDVSGVAAQKTSSLVLEAGETNWTTTVTGTTASYLDVRSRELLVGSFITDEDEAQRSNSMVLGYETAQELFGRTNVVGQKVTVSDKEFEVVGVLTSVGSDTSSNRDDIAIIPLSTMAEQVVGGSSSESVQTIYLKATNQDVLSAAKQEANQLLLNLHGISDADSADFSITSQDSLVETATSVYRTLTILLTGVAALSLLVGGIGVMNIMLVSVTERIREIGLRKALGAPPVAIRNQFLMEAGILGMVGGLLGVGLGIGGAKVLPSLIDTSVVVSLPAVFLALGISILIGIGFGVYPAQRASRLAPIDALRTQ